MLFFNHSSAESVRWVHLFFYNKESKVSQPQTGLFSFSLHDLKDQFAQKLKFSRYLLSPVTMESRVTSRPPQNKKAYSPKQLL